MNQDDPVATTRLGPTDGLVFPDPTTDGYHTVSGLATVQIPSDQENWMSPQLIPAPGENWLEGSSETLDCASNSTFYPVRQTFLGNSAQFGIGGLQSRAPSMIWPESLTQYPYGESLLSTQSAVFLLYGATGVGDLPTVWPADTVLETFHQVPTGQEHSACIVPGSGSSAMVCQTRSQVSPHLKNRKKRGRPRFYEESGTYTCRRNPSRPLIRNMASNTVRSMLRPALHTDHPLLSDSIILGQKWSDPEDASRRCGNACNDPEGGPKASRARNKAAATRNRAKMHMTGMKTEVAEPGASLAHEIHSLGPCLQFRSDNQQEKSEDCIATVSGFEDLSEGSDVAVNTFPSNFSGGADEALYMASLLEDMSGQKICRQRMEKAMEELHSLEVMLQATTKRQLLCIEGELSNR